MLKNVEDWNSFDTLQFWKYSWYKKMKLLGNLNIQDILETLKVLEIAEVTKIENLPRILKIIFKLIYFFADMRNLKIVKKIVKILRSLELWMIWKFSNIPNVKKILKFRSRGGLTVSGLICEANVAWLRILLIYIYIIMRSDMRLWFIHLVQRLWQKWLYLAYVFVLGFFFSFF